MTSATYASLSEALIQAGYEVLTASNGKEAYSIIQERDWDVLLCGWRMPEMNSVGLLCIFSAKRDGSLIYPRSLLRRTAQATTLSM
jgi:DNA-binding response OmpR family regulator